MRLVSPTCGLSYQDGSIMPVEQHKFAIEIPDEDVLTYDEFKKLMEEYIIPALEDKITWFDPIVEQIRDIVAAKIHSTFRIPCHEVVWKFQRLLFTNTRKSDFLASTYKDTISWAENYHRKAQ